MQRNKNLDNGTKTRLQKIKASAEWKLDAKNSKYETQTIVRKYET